MSLQILLHNLAFHTSNTSQTKRFRSRPCHTVHHTHRTPNPCLSNILLHDESNIQVHTPTQCPLPFLGYTTQAYTNYISKTLTLYIRSRYHLWSTIIDTFFAFELACERVVFVSSCPTRKKEEREGEDILQQSS